MPTSDSPSTENTSKDGDDGLEPIKEHLESIVRGFVNAMNTKQLHPDVPIFKAYVDPKFRACPAPPSPQIPLPFPEYIARSREVTTEFPELEHEILTMDVDINSGNGEAQVFVNYNISGAPPGIVYNALGIFRFRLSDRNFAEGKGKWKCYTLDIAGQGR